MKFRETIYYNVEEFERLKNMRNEGMFSVSMAVNLDYTGKERCNKGHRFGPFVRNCFLIHVVTDGRGIYRLKGRKYELGAGKAFVIFPGVETIYQASDEDPWTYYWVGMHGYNVEEFFSSIDVTPDDPIIDLNDTREIVDSISEMIRTSQMTHANELIRLGQAIRFMGLLEKHRVREVGLSGEQRYPAKVYVEAAMAYIRSNYRGDVKIGEIAEYIGINRCYLARNFKKETDMTPKEYLINYRLERAALGLTSNDDPISQVAMRVGYPDQMAFSKAFKKKYGSSPQQYRKEQKQALVLKKQDVMLTRAK